MSDENKNIEISEEQRSEITEFGSLTARSSRGNIHCLTIVGQIVIVDNDIKQNYSIDITLLNRV